MGGPPGSPMGDNGEVYAEKDVDNPKKASINDKKEEK